MPDTTIQNRVTSSSLITIDLETFFPAENEIAVWDMKELLFMGLIIKEAAYRESLTKIDWEEYRDKYVALTCSADAIIPHWAWMLAATYLQPVARSLYYGKADAMKEELVMQQISRLNTDEYIDKRIVIKGCGNKPIPAAAYMALTAKLLPVAKSIMYGEPCSTVPVFKRK